MTSSAGSARWLRSISASVLPWRRSITRYGTGDSPTSITRTTLSATNPAAVPGEPAANGTTPATPTPGTDPAVKPINTPKRDSKLSDKLVQQARAALAGGKRKEAESLFHQALSADNRNAAALIGLSDLEFDRGAHQRAADYAEKAIAASPKSGSYHLKLGDAYFKLLRYADARRAYEKAKDLGVREADERLAKVKSKLGK